MEEKHQIIQTNDGSDTLISHIYGDLYHSKHGSLQESMHVFISSGLHQRLDLGVINVLEVGFGTGLNAWLTCLESTKFMKKINYTGFEKHPIDFSTIKKLNYSQLIEDQYERFNKIHRCTWGKMTSISESFNLIKKDKDIYTLEDGELYDVVYFDAFAPDTQPELWDTKLFNKLYGAMKMDACLVTYCAKGQVKRNLKAVGFEIEAIPGPVGKREMTRAWKQ